MVGKVLSPGVKDSSEPKLCPQVFFIQRQLFKRFGHRLEEEGVHGSLVLENQPVQVVRQGEYDMEIRDVQEVLLLF